MPPLCPPCILQVELVEQLCAIATDVKATRDAHRQTALVQRLKRLSDMFVGCFRLPLDPSLQVWGVDIEVWLGGWHCSMAVGLALRYGWGVDIAVCYIR